MSGTTLDFSDPAGSGGGDESDFVVSAQVIAVQIIDETAQGIVTHEGTVTAAFSFSYNGMTMSFGLFQEIIADLPLYTALAASSTAVASITWNN